VRALRFLLCTVSTGYVPLKRCETVPAPCTVFPSYRYVPFLLMYPWDSMYCVRCRSYVPHPLWDWYTLLCVIPLVRGEGTWVPLVMGLRNDAQGFLMVPLGTGVLLSVYRLCACSPFGSRCFLDGCLLVRLPSVSSLSVPVPCGEVHAGGSRSPCVS
jgi:hypothetical protein